MSSSVFDIDDIVTIKESPTYLQNGGRVLGLTEDKRTAFIRFDVTVPVHLISHAEGITGLRCAFCGKKSSEVVKMIMGRKAYICNECVAICVEIIADDEKTTPEVEKPEPRKTKPQRKKKT